MIMRWILALLIALALAGCHDGVDFPESSSGGGSVSQPPQEQPGEQPQPPASVPSVEQLSGSSFVWKPVSDGDGRLVVLLPASSDADPVFVNGEAGTFVGRTNGNRPTYRFSRPGSQYSAPALLQIGSGTWGVPNPGQRYD